MNKKKILFIGFSLLIVFLICTFIYLTSYSKAMDEVKEYLRSDVIDVIDKDDYYFFDSPNDREAFIFYPGGRVEYTAYAPLLYKLSLEGIDCFLMKMPYNLAIFDINAADKIIKEYEYDDYYIGGHSLGGAAASMYVKDKSNIKGIIFLAAYPNNRLPSNMKVLSIYGSKDGVLNKDKYNDNKKYFNKDYVEVVIEGGNHAQFGYYGKQDKDKEATITREEQQKKTITEIANFIKY